MSSRRSARFRAIDRLGAATTARPPRPESGQYAIPDAESTHAYPHSTDFDPGPGQTGYDNYALDDSIAFAFYRNWITQSRAHVDTAWGATIGDQIRFSISEWNAGVSRTTNADFVAPSTNWPGKYNLINNHGTTSPQYDTFKAVSLADPPR